MSTSRLDQGRQLARHSFRPDGAIKAVHKRVQTNLSSGRLGRARPTGNRTSQNRGASSACEATSASDVVAVGTQSARDYNCGDAKTGEPVQRHCLADPPYARCATSFAAGGRAPQRVMIQQTNRAMIDAFFGRRTVELEKVARRGARGRPAKSPRHC